MSICEYVALSSEAKQAIALYMATRANENKGSPKLSNAQKLDLLVLFAQGERVDVIAQRFGVQPITVYKYAKAVGISRPRLRRATQPRQWVAEARQMFERGAKCREIADAVGLAEKTIMQEAARAGWQRQSLSCYKCGASVPPSKKKNSADDRVCRRCSLKRYREKRAKLRRENPDYIRAERQRYKAKLHAEGIRRPMVILMQEYEQARKQKPRSAASQLGRYRHNGEPPINQAGALAILQATLRKLLAFRCEAEGLVMDSVEYRARYNADPAFRERERLRTSGKRWGNRAEGRDDGTLTKEAVRRLFSKAKQCPYCWQPMKSQDKSLDHMEPLSRGGWHSASNVLVCCRRCNSRKNDTPWSEWLSMIPAACERAIREKVA